MEMELIPQMYGSGLMEMGMVLYALKDFLIKRLGSLLEHTT